MFMIAKQFVWFSLSICIVGGSLLVGHSLSSNFSPSAHELNLKETMKVIQDGLNGVGPIEYDVKYHNNSTGEDRTVHSRQEISKVSADPDSCYLIYEHQSYLNNKHHQFGYVVHLKTVMKVAVVTEEQDLKKGDLAMGHPEFSTHVTPPVFVVQAMKSDPNDQNTFVFLNEEQANRMAKALAHAVELCGGRKLESPH